MRRLGLDLVVGRVTALVLGSGVIGLTTALRLQAAGCSVRIWTATRWPETVSSVAAAIWYPFRAHPLERVEAWSAASLEVFRGLAGDPATGVRMLEGRVRERDGCGTVTDDPSVRVPGIEMPVYLAWLERRFLEGGGTLELRRVDHLGQALEACPLVVNCTGLGARELAADPSLHPIRGQVLRVENPGIERFTLDDEPGVITYVIPRSRDVVLGGTAEDGDWSLAPDPAVLRAIRERCEALEPALRGARVLGEAVGLRPGRPAVRLERVEHAGGRRVVHNYGHGGSGVTISWGCADEVVGMID